MNSLDRALGLFSEKRSQIFLMFIILSLNSLVLILPYLINGYKIPVGWDTAWYITNMRLIEEQGVFSLFTKTREINLFCILEYMFASIFSISFTLTAIIVPIMIGLLLSLANFQIVKEISRSWKLALASMVFTIIDYNTMQMIAVFHRNLFCFLLIEITVFLVLPGFLAKPSRKGFLIFVLLLIMAGLSQMETFAIAMIMLFISLILCLKGRLPKTAKLLLLCVLTSSLIVILFEAPFLPLYVQGNMFLNPSVKWHRRNFIADPWRYLVSFGAGLIPFYIVGLYDLLKETSRNLQEYRNLFISLWNVIAIAGSFLPVFGVRIPGSRLLLLVTIPLVAALGFQKLLVQKGSFTKKKALLLTVLITVNLIVIIVNQSQSYRPWISEDEYGKLMWISNANRHSSNIIFVLSFDWGTHSFDWAELYRRWIWAVVGTRTNVYFGDVKDLIIPQPTDFENQFLNVTSHAFWNELEDFTLDNARIYTIEEWYQNPLNETRFGEVESGIYFMELD